MAFSRPTPKNNPPAWRRKPPVTAANPLTDENAPTPTASPWGTMVMLMALALTGVTLAGDTPTQLAKHAAIGTTIGLLLSIAFDVRAGGLRNLIRTDLMALVAVYALTLFEFLFPITRFDLMTDTTSTATAVEVTLLGIGGLVIGRHWASKQAHPLAGILTRPSPRSWMITLFWACFVIGFIHMPAATEWNLWTVVEFWMEPRFTQPWGRGRLGDWKALLVELSMLLYLIPPLAGIIFARRKNYTGVQLATVFFGLFVVLFYGFSSGTRNIFFSFLVTFLIGYAFALPIARRKEMIMVGASCAAVMLVCTVFMLKFRDVGLKAYMNGDVPVDYEDPDRHMQVDLNLNTISAIVRIFPKMHPYLGMEVPYLAIIRPIPRAIWPGKPEGMSESLETAVGGDSSFTVAASFIGEAYMAGGAIAVFCTGLMFGAIMAWWNRLASPRNSEFGILIYASGFFAAVISMRSVFVFTTAMLPTLTAIVLGAFFLGKYEDRKKLEREFGPPAPVPRRR